MPVSVRLVEIVPDDEPGMNPPSASDQPWAAVHTITCCTIIGWNEPILESGKHVLSGFDGEIVGWG